jgi:hypothetical protein
METDKPARKPRARRTGNAEDGEQPPARRTRSRKRVSPGGTDGAGPDLQPQPTEGTQEIGAQDNTVAPAAPGQADQVDDAAAAERAVQPVDPNPDGAAGSRGLVQAAILETGSPSPTGLPARVADAAEEHPTRAARATAEGPGVPAADGGTGTADDPDGTAVIPINRTAGTSGGDAGVREEAGNRRPGSPRADGRRSEGPGLKQRALDAARVKFANDRSRAPLEERQIDSLLDLLHRAGQDRTLVSSTYTYLTRGMSRAHADVQIKKLRGEFREDRRAA